MEIGICLQQLGAFGTPEMVGDLASAAEARGYHEVWAIDRLLDPVEPRSQYPVGDTGRIPAEQRIALDPVVALSIAAAHTSRIRIGTNVLVAPWYRPALLARSLASLDVVSRGRLDIGLGLGWSDDEYEAVGVPRRGLAAAQIDLIEALEALWQPGVVAHEGPDYRVAPSHVGLRPVQQPRPPILLAAYTPAGLQRAGTLADGWTPSGLDLPTTAAMWGVVTAAADEAGRDPADLSLVIHAGIRHTVRPLGPGRPTYHGSVEQIADDVRGAFDIGARQVVYYLSSASSMSELFDLADAITSAADLPVGV